MKNNYLGYNKQTMKKEFCKQDEAYKKGDALNHTFYIAKDHKYLDKQTNEYKVCKYVSSFIDIDEYLNWFDGRGNKHFYEKLRYEQRLEYYDIDGKIEDHDYWKNSKETILNDFFQERKNWIETTNFTNKQIDPEKDIFILESRKLNKKKSFHIIIRNGFVFQSIKEQKEFMKSFHTYLTELNTGLTIDLAPYSNNQVFRTLGSCKIDTDRTLIRSDYNKNSLTCDRRLFYISYLTPEIKEYCNKSGLDYNLSSKSYIRQKELNFVAGFDEKVEKISIPKDREQKFSENDLIVMFDNLSVKRWDDRQTCYCLIWLGIKYGLTTDDIHIFCKKSEKYSEKWVDDMIEQYNSEKISSTIGTIKFYLREDLDGDTYDKIVPKNKTFTEIMNIPKKERTKEEQKYLDQTINTINKKNLKILTETNSFTERKEDKYVRVRDINSGKFVVIKAGLGKGKTTATINHVNNFDYDCIIILTPRRTYAKSTLSRVQEEINLPDGEKFVLYSDMKGSIREKYIIIQVESLCRFNFEFENKNTLLILDEVESLLYQMTSHKTHGQNHIQNIDMFERIIKNSNKVLCMDAFISLKTINTLKKLNCEYTYYNYTKKLEKRKAIRYDKKNILKNKLIKELKEGKKCYFFCSSRKQLTDYFLAEIKQELPDKNIIEYHSKKISIDLTTINDTWKKADLIVATCTISVGCNFDLPDVFNSIFVYASACSRNLVRDIFQSTYRVRHIIDKVMYYCLDTKHNGLNLATNIKEIEDTIKNRVYFHKKHYEKYLKMDFTEETPKWIRYLLINNIFESNMSIMCLESVFNKYLELCNYEIVDEDDEELDDLDIEDKKDDLIFSDDYLYEDIPTINFDEAQKLLIKKRKEPLTDFEEFKLNKYYFQSKISLSYKVISIDEQISLWNIYCNYGKSKFRNLSYEKGLIDGTLRICDIISSTFPELADSLSKKLEDIRDIAKQFNLKNSQDFSTITKLDIENNLNWLQKNRKRFITDFSIREQGKSKGDLDIRKGIDLLNKIFSSWGYSKIKKGKQKKKRINGKIIDISNYNFENTEDIDVYRHIEPRTIKQYERKVKIITDDSLPL